ncbi:MAG TPA: hypothetical protein VNT53_00680 [Pseudolysinimonas sp.]|nr:hypothetical protein [Pseudolysinimonas sp.]
MTGGRNKRQQSKRVRQRRVSVRAVRRSPVDPRKLSRILIALAEADAEAAAKAQHRAAHPTDQKSENKAPTSTTEGRD